MAVGMYSYALEESREPPSQFLNRNREKVVVM